jgi:uncharacterized membrane protein
MNDLKSQWHRVKSSLWFFPGILTATGILLAMLTIRIDESINPSGRMHSLWLFSGGSDGARGVLSAIASTTVTVAATVFSIVVVAIQLASSQFTPRVLQSIMRDRVNQITLGAFLGTFTYSLLVLRSVRSGTDNDDPFIPALSVTVAFLLALICMGLLILFIHHAARSMEAATVIGRTTREARAVVDRTYPDDTDATAGTPALPEILEPSQLLTADRAGYLAAVELDNLVRCATDEALIVRVEPVIGDFLLPGALLATVWRQPDTTHKASQAKRESGESEPVETVIRRTIHLLDDPSEQDDLAYNVQRLADIAVKAMSPGINDPTTARLCVDRISDVIVRAGTRSPVPDRYADDQGVARVLWQHDPWERIVVVAFDQIAHYSASDLQVMLHLSRTLERIAGAVPAARAGAVRSQARLLAERGAAALATETERAHLINATGWARTSPD